MSGFYIGDWGTCSRPSAPESPTGSWQSASVSIAPPQEIAPDWVTRNQLQLAIDAAIARIKFPEPPKQRSDRELAIALMPLLGLPVAVVLPEPNTLELRDAFGKTILTTAGNRQYIAFEAK